MQLDYPALKGFIHTASSTHSESIFSLGIYYLESSFYIVIVYEWNSRYIKVRTNAAKIYDGLYDWVKRYEECNYKNLLNI